MAEDRALPRLVFDGGAAAFAFLPKDAFSEAGPARFRVADRVEEREERVMEMSMGREDQL